MPDTPTDSGRGDLLQHFDLEAAKRIARERASQRGEQIKAAPIPTQQEVDDAIFAFLLLRENSATLRDARVLKAHGFHNAREQLFPKDTPRYGAAMMGIQDAVMEKLPWVTRELVNERVDELVNAGRIRLDADESERISNGVYRIAPEPAKLAAQPTHPTFLELRKRMLAVEHADPEAAQRRIDAVTGDAVRLFLRYVNSGAGGIFAAMRDVCQDYQPKTVCFTLHRFENWKLQALWRFIAEGACSAYPDRLPNSSTFGGAVTSPGGQLTSYPVQDWPTRRDDYASLLGILAEEAGERDDAKPVADGNAKPEAGKGRRRKRKAAESSALTAKQTETAQIVGECKGDIAEAARRMGKDRKTVKQHYDAAMRKLGKTAMPKPKTQRLADEHLGQPLRTSRRLTESPRDRRKD